MGLSEDSLLKPFRLRAGNAGTRRRFGAGMTNLPDTTIVTA